MWKRTYYIRKVGGGVRQGSEKKKSECWSLFPRSATPLSNFLLIPINVNLSLLPDGGPFKGIGDDEGDIWFSGRSHVEKNF